MSRCVAPNRFSSQSEQRILSRLFWCPNFSLHVYNYKLCNGPPVITFFIINQCNFQSNLVNWWTGLFFSPAIIFRLDNDINTRMIFLQPPSFWTCQYWWSFFWVFWKLLESICEKNALFCGTRDTGAAALLFWLLGQKLLLVLVLLVVAWHEGDFVKIKKMQSPTLLRKAYVKKHFFCVLFWIEPFGLTGSTVLFYVL